MQLIRLASAAELLDIERMVGHAIAKWSESWCFINQETIITATNMNRHQCKNQPRKEISQTSDLLMSLDTSEVNMALLLFGELAQKCPIDDMFSHILTSSKSELIEQLLTEFGVNSLQPHSKRSENSDAGSKILVSVSLKSGIEVFRLTLGSAFIQPSDQPKRSSYRQPLIKRDEAIKTATARVIVKLSFGPAKLQSLRGLSVGDTLRTDAPIARPMTLKLNENTELPCLLGRSDERKAVVLLRK